MLRWVRMACQRPAKAHRKLAGRELPVFNLKLTVFEDGFLSGPHGRFFFGGGVIVAQQVQRAVRGQQSKFGLDWMTGLGGLLGGARIRDDHISQVWRLFWRFDE